MPLPHTQLQHTLAPPKPKDLHMVDPQDVHAMVRLQALGWGCRRIARELGVARNTVRRYLRQGGWTPYKKPLRQGALDGLDDWLRECFLRHRGNAAVVRQQLRKEHGIEVSLRTVERAVGPFRQEFVSAAKATVRFETRPGEQLQIDFGSMRVAVADEIVVLHLFVATLGYSRRIFVAPFRHERQSAWLGGLEASFRHFDGVPEHVLMDNARALVRQHNRETGEVAFNDRLLAFCRHWRTSPKACRPYRARTKGKDERAVQYVKRNALAGHAFETWEALEAHLAWWMREVADIRVHGTTGERPIDRFRQEEAASLDAIQGRPPFRQVRELQRRVQSDLCVEVDSNQYSVPWHHIGHAVTVIVAAGRVEVRRAGKVVAEHAEHKGRGHRSIDIEHFKGVAGAASALKLGSGPDTKRPREPAEQCAVPPPCSELARSLSVYEEAVGGAF